MMNDCADTQLTDWWQSYLSSNRSALIIKERIISVSSYNSNSCFKGGFGSFHLIFQGSVMVQEYMYLFLYDNDACRIKSGFKKEINVTSAFTFVYCLHSQGAKTIV